MCSSPDDEWVLDNSESIAIDFYTASSLGLQDLVEFYIRRGQNVNEPNEGGWTAIMYACASLKNTLVSFLLNEGADITHVDKCGNTFISVAAQNGNFKALSYFECSIQEGRTEYCNQYDVLRVINLPEYKHGYTPLMFSASQGDTDMVRTLLRLGAKTAVKDANGRTAVELSLLNGHKSTNFILKFSGEFTIQDLLKEICLEKYTDLFANIRIDELLLMEDRDLKDLGLILLGPRKKLKLAIEKLNGMKSK